MQYYRSKSLEGLEYQQKYNLDDYTNPLLPLVIFGMYREDDYQTLINHESEVIIVWQGMDAKEVNSNWILEIKKAKNISISHWIKESLNSYGIESELKYLSATEYKNINHPNGDYVYFYCSDDSESSLEYYGANMIDEIEERTGIKIIRTFLNSHTKKQLNEIYKKCFINLRLTNHDGCPNTNLELGLMGRKSIYNGSLPHSIKWTDVNDICQSILIEYENRKKDNKQVSNDFIKFINDNKL